VEEHDVLVLEKISNDPGRDSLQVVRVHEQEERVDEPNLPRIMQVSRFVRIRVMIPMHARIVYNRGSSAKRSHQRNEPISEWSCLKGLMAEVSMLTY
jgi:hypothetical protein